jgi:hypothetical protein
VVHDKGEASPCACYLPVGSSLLLCLRLVVSYGIYQAFTYVNHTVNSSALSLDIFGRSPFPCGSGVSFRWGYIVRGALYRNVTIPAYPRRVPLMEQRGLSYFYASQLLKRPRVATPPLTPPYMRVRIRRFIKNGADLRALDFPSSRAEDARLSVQLP